MTGRKPNTRGDECKGYFLKIEPCSEKRARISSICRNPVIVKPTGFSSRCWKVDLKAWILAFMSDMD